MSARLRRFLAELAVDGNVLRAARAAAIGRATVYQRRAADAAFAEAWRAAELEAAANIEAEVFRRGHEGWDETRTDGSGKVTSSVRRYSDACLLALARVRVPDFRTEHVKISHEISDSVRAEIRAAVAREAPRPLPRVTTADLANTPTNVDDFLARIAARRRSDAEAAAENEDGE